MPLDEYQRKRDFRSTPEPTGGAATATGRRFVIHKHDATNLHYDFRLELNGALVSWAVPKGPSMDPGDKRLAIHVEDHPLDYGDFEGTIPKGQYGGGTVMLWDDGDWEPETDHPGKDLKKGKLSFTLHGRKLNGGWTLTRIRHSRGDGDKDNWLLIKHDDGFANKDGTALLEHEARSVKTGRSLEEIAGATGNGASKRRKAAPKPKKPPGGHAPVVDELPRARMPASIEPQLCTLTDAVPEGDDWLHEIKFDGYRLIARLKDGEASLITRGKKDWTDRFPPIARAMEGLPVENCIIDGEACILDTHGQSSFQQLQQALKEHAFTRLVFFVFDLLYLNGRDLRKQPLIERKELLRELIPTTDAGVLRFSDHTRGGGERVHRAACRLGLEGVISKQVRGVYQQTRSKSWLKVKCTRRQEFIVIGFSAPSGQRKRFGSLLLGAHDEEGRLVYTGRVGTGFTDAELELYGDKLDALTRKTCPADVPPTRAEQRGVTWVTPELVVEVEFTQWTDDGRLRHPSCQGLREDKPAQEVRIEHREPLEQAMSEIKQSELSDTGPASMGAKARRPNPGGKGKADPADSADSVVMGVRISSPQRPVFPDAGVTKLGLARYYELVADRIMPFIEHRPLSTVRCPNGRDGQCFFQKHMGTTFSEPVHAIEAQEKSGTAMYIGVDSAQSLITLIQFGVIEIHPWGAREGKLDAPDQLTFDLDPGEGVAWDALPEAALSVRGLLEEAGLSSFVKLSGGKGLHVVAPLRHAKGDPGWDDAKGFCKALANRMVRMDPKRYIANMSKQKRKGKVFIDYLRNGRGATSVAPYSARAREGAPVSAPIRWDELASTTGGGQYTINTMPQRLSRLGSDPWDQYHSVRQRLTRKRIGVMNESS